MAASFAVGHLGSQMRYLDIAVEDFDAASAELRDALDARSIFMASYEDIAEAYAASVASGNEDAFRATAFRFHYRLDCAYAAARRVLDRVVVVANELLPRPYRSTDLQTTHHGFHSRLVARCADLELELPGSLLAQIDDLSGRIKTARDQMEHVTYPKSLRSIRQEGDELVVEWRTIVPVGDTPKQMSFETASVLRDSIHDYVGAMVGLLERAQRTPS